jgi:heat-inducible transcriptional repressor
VPTDKGYRVFVDHLAELRPLSAAQRSAISSFLTDPGDLDELLMRTVRALTQLTGQVAIVQYPSFARANVTHVEFVHLGGARVVVIVVTDTGRVSQRVAFLAEELTEDAAPQVKTAIARLVTGKPVAEARPRSSSSRRGPDGTRIDAACAPSPASSARSWRTSARTGSSWPEARRSLGARATSAAASTRCWRPSRSRSPCCV